MNKTLHPGYWHWRSQENVYNQWSSCSVLVCLHRPLPLSLRFMAWNVFLAVWLQPCGQWRRRFISFHSHMWILLGPMLGKATGFNSNSGNPRPHNGRHCLHQGTSSILGACVISRSCGGSGWLRCMARALDRPGTCKVFNQRPEISCARGDVGRTGAIETVTKGHPAGFFFCRVWQKMRLPGLLEVAGLAPYKGI